MSSVQGKDSKEHMVGHNGNPHQLAARIITAIQRSPNSNRTQIAKSLGKKKPTISMNLYIDEYYNFGAIYISGVGDRGEALYSMQPGYPFGKPDEVVSDSRLPPKNRRKYHFPISMAK